MIVPELLDLWCGLACKHHFPLSAFLLLRHPRATHLAGSDLLCHSPAVSSRLPLILPWSLSGSDLLSLSLEFGFFRLDYASFFVSTQQAGSGFDRFIGFY